jgi:hypothetical protein
MNVKKIIARHLKKYGFDGLWAEGYPGCGCGCDGTDFMPCDTNCGDCRPGYKVEAKDFTKKEKAEFDGYLFIIGPRKP